MLSNQVEKFTKYNATSLMEAINHKIIKHLECKIYHTNKRHQYLRKTPRWGKPTRQIQDERRQTLSQDQPQTKEEKDIISQSKKKLLRRSNGEPISILAPTQVDDVIMANFTFQQTYTPAPRGSRFFKETAEGKAKPHIYDGANEEDELDAFVVEDMERDRGHFIRAKQHLP
ncbi:hypothetical protein AAG906_027313 [Vitis piasezkii]